MKILWLLIKITTILRFDGKIQLLEFDFFSRENALVKHYKFEGKNPIRLFDDFPILREPVKIKGF